MDENRFISFVCQRCLQPLYLDKSLNNVGEHMIADLSLPLFSSPKHKLEVQNADYDHFIPSFNLNDYGVISNSFTKLNDAEESNLCHHIKLKVAAEMFDIMSENTGVNHPMCEECTNAHLKIIDQHYLMIRDDLYHYKLYLEKTDKESNDLSSLVKELERLEEEETELVEELNSIQKKEILIQNDIVEAKSFTEEIERDEEQFWRQYNKYSRDLFCLEDENRSTEYQLKYAQFNLDRLRKNDVFYTTFRIWLEGNFGIINNFRLGRLPSTPVDWREINGAWGQATLLLAALARKCNVTFQKYRLVPYGSRSYIEVLANHKELPLYGSSGFRFLINPKFDSAMVAFLDCLQQFKEEVEKGESGFNLPYRMEKGKIKDSGTGKSYSIAIQFNSEEQWTKALKLMLTNLKWVVAWVASQFCDE